LKNAPWPQSWLMINTRINNPLAMIATGQSGHPLSDQWGSLLQRWRDGGVLRLGRDAEREAGRIRLTP
jgi:penicillin amidase